MDNKPYKNPMILLNQESNSKPLTKQRRLKKITKRIFNPASTLQFLRDKKLSKTAIISLIVALFLFGIYIALFTSFFDVKNIEVSENNMHIQKLLEPLRNRNIFLLKLSPVSDNLKLRIDNLAELRVTKKLPDTIVVSYVTFKNIANVVNIVGRQRVKKSFIINETGTITQKDQKLNNAPLIFMESDKAFNIGDEITTPAITKYIIDSQKYFEEKLNIKVLNIDFLPKAREIHLNTEKGFSVWLDLDQDYKLQINKLKNAIPKLNIYEDNFEYIDLRIQSAEGQKIIYKRR